MVQSWVSVVIPSLCIAIFWLKRKKRKVPPALSLFMLEREICVSILKSAHFTVFPL
jgi:hypothetical protein